MSKQIKNKKIDDDKIKISKLQSKIHELDYLLEIKYKACDDLLNENKILTVNNAKLEEQAKMKDNNIELWKEKCNKLERVNEQLKAENYSLKNRGFFKKVQSLLGA